VLEAKEIWPRHRNVKTDKITVVKGASVVKIKKTRRAKRKEKISCTSLTIAKSKKRETQR
jgi:hypothetical protein